MELACPKCSTSVTVSAETASHTPVLCSKCGESFDLPKNSSVQTKLPQPPVIEEISPEAAAAELKKQKIKAEPRSSRTPKKIGAYDVIEEISRGGMGIVYKAVDAKLRRTVAIKVLLAGDGAKDEDFKRFQREAQATARLHHPNIVQIYAVGEHDGLPYLVMDFIEGKTAKQLKEEGKMTPRLALSIIEGCAEGLHHAHLHGVIHRDVKPANIIVDKNERAQLMDFGLARRVDEDLEVTQSGTTMGTPSYMSPEQAEGKLDEIDAQSDVYSAGACMYELLTGRPPFEAPTIMATLKKVLEHNPAGPRKINPKIHRDIETICLKCLEKEKGNRYGSALQLAEDIRRFNAGETITAKPLGFFGTCARWARQHKEITLAILIVLIPAVAAMTYSAVEARRAANKVISDRERDLRDKISAGQTLLLKIREMVDNLKDSEREDFQDKAIEARSLIAEANMTFKQAEGMSPDNVEIKRGLDVVKKLDNEVEVRRFIAKARAFLNPKQGRPEDPPITPNYAGAEFAAQEAADRDPDNAEARELLRVAVGMRKVNIECAGRPCAVFARKTVDSLGRALPNAGDLGIALGNTPVEGRELEPGHYVITFQRTGMKNQQMTLTVARDSREDELSLRLAASSPDENMSIIAEGTVSLPQVGPVKVPEFAIDRFEYPNKAGAIPATGMTLAEAQSTCKQQGKSLCSSAQWLRACMGDDERRYPYGKSYVSRMCATGYDEAQKQPLPSGSYSRCRTAEGVYDMSGNVNEWTDGDAQQEIVFGGDWTSPTRFADLTLSCRARSLQAEVNKDHMGFRCCKSTK